MSSAFLDSSTPQRHTPHSVAGDSAVSGSLRLSGSGLQQQHQYPIHPLSEPDEIEYNDNLSNQDDVDVSDFAIPNGVVPASEAPTAAAAAAAAAVAVDRHRGRKRADIDRHQQHHHHHADKGLKGAFKSVVAWGSGLGQRLQRVGSNVLQQQGGSSATARPEQTGVQGASGSSSRAHKGPSSSQELANF